MRQVAAVLALTAAVLLTLYAGYLGLNPFVISVGYNVETTLEDWLPCIGASGVAVAMWLLAGLFFSLRSPKH